MNVVDVTNLEKSYGPRKVLGGVSFALGEGEKVGLIGRNGCGKSTLLQILSEEEDSDGGTVVRQRNLTVGHLWQEPDIDPELTVRQAIETALGEARKQLIRFAEISETLQDAKGEEASLLLDEQHAIQGWIDLHGGWNLDHKVEEISLHLGIPDMEQVVGTLSGGLRKRVALARLLLAEPDLLLLDEPTNHLDADTVDWLEGALSSYPGAVLLVTHDRYFLDRVVTRMLELDDGTLTPYVGGYGEYLEQKSERLEMEGRAQSRLANLLRREEAWLHRGAKARTTKQKARIGRVHALREQKKEVGTAQVRLDLETAPRLGGTVLECSNLVLKREERTLVKGLDFILRRGERVGIVGPNGCGKTTLLKSLLGELEPSEGNVIVGRQTRIGYLDQARSGLDPDQFVHEAVGEGDWVTLPDGTKRHKIGYLEGFLFSPDEQRKRISTLSGGERARLLLSKLLLEGANVLVLDEPTNDIDIPTLQSLEEALEGFAGSLLVVTHDRYFLDRVVTGMLHFEGEGRVVFYEGNYETFCRLRAEEEEDARLKKAQQKKEEPSPVREKKRAGLSYKEKIELEEVEREIDLLEGRKLELERVLSDPSASGGQGGIEAVGKEFNNLEERLSTLMERWEELELKKEGAS